MHYYLYCTYFLSILIKLDYFNRTIIGFILSHSEAMLVGPRPLLENHHIKPT